MNPDGKAMEHPVHRAPAGEEELQAAASRESLAELTRIREAYQRRAQTVPTDRYSRFKPDSMLRVQEIERQLVGLLARNGFSGLQDKKILEIGCGVGVWLRAFLQWRALPENLYGIDLLTGRIEEARKMCPQGVHLECGNAAALAFPEASFDLVLQSTVFTSILDPTMRQRIAAEMLRVLKPGGYIIWYDFHVNNPRNRDVRGIKKREIGQLFPGCRVYVKRVTLAPPIGRLVAPMSPLVYVVLSSLRVFCTHYLGLIAKV